MQIHVQTEASQRKIHLLSASIPLLRSVDAGNTSRSSSLKFTTLLISYALV